MNALHRRWKKDWTGTANDVVAEAAHALAGTEIEPPTRRSFDNYIAKNCVSLAAGKGAYGSRHILQAIAVRLLLRDSWPLERIADFTSTSSDQALTELVESALSHLGHKTAAQEGPPPEQSAAMAAVLKLRHDSGLGKSSAASPQERNPEPLSGILRQSRLLGGQASVFSAGGPADPSGDRLAIQIHEAAQQSYGAHGVTITIDPAAAPSSREAFDRITQALLRRAADGLFAKG